MAITILVIDDAAHIRSLVVRMLEQAGFNTLEASNGLQGLQLLKQHKVALVISDVSMPIMDGYQFIATMRTDAEISQVPVIIITAAGEEDQAALASQMHAEAYLTKPFSSTKLIETIQNQLQTK